MAPDTKREAGLVSWTITCIPSRAAADMVGKWLWYVILASLPMTSDSVATEMIFHALECNLTMYETSSCECVAR